MTENIFKKAVTFHQNKNFKEAKKLYEQLLKSNSENLSILQNYASLLSQIKEYKKANDIFKRCVKMKPQDPLLLYNYAKFFHDQKIYNKAIDFYLSSFNFDAKNYLSIYNVGNIYNSQGEFEKAIDAFKKVIDINPSNSLAYNNLAIAYKSLGNFKDAIKYYNEAIKIDKNYIDAHVNLSTMLLTVKNFKEGLEEYEWRKKSKSFKDFIDYRQLSLKSDEWNGQTLDGKKLLIIAEQGIGDLIQFSRYLYLIKEKYKTNIILKIKGNNFLHFFNKGDFEVISDNKLIPDHNYHIHMMSLLRIFHKSGQFFFKPVNFLPRSQSIKNKWSKKIIKISGLKIGINSLTSSEEKNIPFDYFLNLAKNFEYNFLILQKKITPKVLEKIQNKRNIFYFKKLDDGNDAFIDSIEIISNLDLIITADTALAHLAATLGKKTWVVIPFIADWRWFDENFKTNWYPNVTLFRQKINGDWQDVFSKVNDNLKKFKQT